MQRKRYFVFISSAQDLKTERNELIRIVSELGAIPITMDTFDITQEKDREIIKMFIGECDYFLNLTAYKIGEAVGKTFALEYEYTSAIEAKIPVLSLIVSEKARWKDTKKEKDAVSKRVVENFKKKLEKHTHDKWTNMADLKQKALYLLSREMNINPRRGWVPSTEAVEPSVANELCRLLRENEDLKNQVMMEGSDIVKKVRERIKSAIKTLANNRISLSFYYTNGENWENFRDFRYLRLFRLLAPELSTPKTTVEISHFLGNILNPDLERIVRKDYPTPSNTVKKIMSDFALLKLVKCAAKEAIDAPVVNDEDWELTSFGKEAFAMFRLRQMNRVKKQHKQESQESTTERVNQNI